MHMSYKELQKAFGQRVQTTRVEKGFASIESFAKEAEVEVEAVEDIEMCRADSTLKTRYNIAKALNVEAVDLFDFARI